MEDSKISAAILENCAVIRVEGRGSFMNSRLLKDFFEKLTQKPCNSFIFDLNECKTMDSTLMGTLAGMAINLKKDDASSRIVLVAPNKQCYRLITTLGLDQILEVRSNFNQDLTGKPFEPIENESDYSQEEKIIHAIEAHETLIEISPDNEVKFRSVLALLKEDLEKGNCDNTES